MSFNNHAADSELSLDRMRQALAGLRGMRIALIAPAGGMRDARIDRILERLDDCDITVVPGAHIRCHHRYLAGTIAERLDDLHTAFTDDSVDMVWCLRGGYGSAHLVSHIDWAAIPSDVPLVGHSDITALANAFTVRGKCAIHGPTTADLLKACPTMYDSSALACSFESIGDCLSGTDRPMALAVHGNACSDITGQLSGGNLTTLASSIDLLDQADLSQPRILMLEDVGEAEFRLERCIHQLVRASYFKSVHAVVLGEFVNCTLGDGMQSLVAVLREHVGPDTAIFYGAPIGHGVSNTAWQYGKTARIRSSARGGYLNVSGLNRQV